MRIEGIVNSLATSLIKMKANLRATLRDTLLIDGHLLRRYSVFMRQVLNNIFAFGSHVRVQLKGLKMDFYASLIFHTSYGLFKRSQANSTPGAGNIGYKINTNRIHLLTVQQGNMQKMLARVPVRELS
jgi:hypothetical protein